MTDNTVFRDSVQPHWLTGNTHFWYEVATGPETHQFVLVDAVAGARRPAFDHARLAELLTQQGVKNDGAEQLPINHLELDLKQRQLLFQAGDRWWKYSLEKEVLAEQPPREVKSTGRPVSRGPHRSLRTGRDTIVRFINHTKKEIEIIWLTPEGQQRSYGRLQSGASRDQHTYAGHTWLITDDRGNGLAIFVAEDDRTIADITGKIEEPRRTQKPSNRSHAPAGTSPDGQWRAFIKNNNVWLRCNETENDVALSDDGTQDDAYDSRFYWSPDSTRLAAVRTKKGDDRQVTLIESSPKDQLQPKVHSFRYLKPGDRIPQDAPQLFDVKQAKHIPIDNELFSNPWSIRDIRWAPDSSRFTFIYNQRGHQVLRVLAVDALTGQVSVLVDEHSDTFIDYAGKFYVHYLDETNELIWMSERDGWNHLYLYDAATGQVKNQITRGTWVVRGVEFVDSAKRQIWFRAGGIRPEQDPYYVHYCRVNFDGTGLVVLTEADGTHEVRFSPDRRFLIDRWSRVDSPPVHELRRAEDGALICKLEQADCSRLLKTGWRAPERFVAKGRDGKTDIFGVVFLPMHFDSKKKYPVIEDIYAGPHSAFVPKGFRTYYKAQAMAELGFIVVKIDGMGTSQRSKAFHDVCWKNLGDSGFPDRILWIRAAAKEYPAMDLTRVGIYGGSAGGQSALRALLAYGDFYQVAVADCGCHDNRMDKIWWNELWMGWPVGPHYAGQSNVTQAHRLQGKLLLVVGELDRNVDPSSTLQVVNALIKADKDFDLLLIPGAGHGAAETYYGNRRRQDFFVRNLLGVEPRHGDTTAP